MTKNLSDFLKRLLKTIFCSKYNKIQQLLFPQLHFLTKYDSYPFPLLFFLPLLLSLSSSLLLYLIQLFFFQTLKYLKEFLVLFNNSFSLYSKLEKLKVFKSWELIFCPNFVFLVSFRCLKPTKHSILHFFCFKKI